MEFHIARATRADLGAIVRIHEVAFPNHFLTQLGSRFLRIYYETVLLCPGGVVLMAVDTHPVGFVAGFVDPTRFYSMLRRNRIRIAASILPAILRSPRVLKRVVLNYRRSKSLSVSVYDGRAELSSLAVCPQHQNRGIGRGLVDVFLSTMGSSGVRTVYLTTDAVANDAVNNFYCRLGFRLAGTLESPPGRVLNEYCIEIEQTTASQYDNHNQ